MALRDKLRTNAQPLLEPGETIVSVFSAQTGPNPNLLAFLPWNILRTKNVVIAATDRRIVVMSARLMGRTKAKGIIAMLPRATRLGPVSRGMGWEAIQLGDACYWVHGRFHKDVAQADAAGQLTAEAPEAS